eukprot:11074205-Karenia_brevis.AAC.1
MVNAKVLLDEIKTGFKARRKHGLVTAEHIVVYPSSPQELLQKHPAVYNSAYPDSVTKPPNGPGGCPHDELAVDSLARRLPARRTHGAIASRSQMGNFMSPRPQHFPSFSRSMTQYDLTFPVPYYVGQPSGGLPYTPPPAQGHQPRMPQLGDRQAPVLAIADGPMVIQDSPPQAPAATPVPAPAETPVPAPAATPVPAALGEIPVPAPAETSVPA